MIKEILTYLHEWPKQKVKSQGNFGHLKESISLIAKQKRCQGQWQGHLDHCHRFINQGTSHAKHFDSLLILGAGPLHEIPIENLALKFKRIVLVDIIHLSSTQKKFRHLPQLEFIHHDISELECDILKNNALIDRIPSAFLNEDWGLVISANLLTQIPLHFSTYFEKNKLIEKLGGHLIVDQFLMKLMENHLHYLKSHAKKTTVLLYTDLDVETMSYLGNNKFQSDFYSSGRNILRNHKLQCPVQTWEWEVSPLHEVIKNVRIKMLVGGFILNN